MLDPNRRAALHDKHMLVWSGLSEDTDGPDTTQPEVVVLVPSNDWGHTHTLTHRPACECGPKHSWLFPNPVRSVRLILHRSFIDGSLPEVP